MALFDKDVSLDENREMHAAFKVWDNSLPSSRASVALSSDIMPMKLLYFASNKSLRFFNAAVISHLTYLP